jgi:hypothetical protein
MPNVDTIKLAAAEQKGTTILIFTPDGIPCRLRVILDHGKDTISVHVFSKDGMGESDQSSFDGIQLRRTSDGDLIGEIHRGRLKKEFRVDFSKDSIYFASSANTPLNGKWETEQ